MRTLALTLVFLIVSFTSIAQIIKGKVLTEKDKNPVQFASVGLMSLPDSAIVSGVITLTDGSYTFQKVNPGSYYLTVSYLGYSPAGLTLTVNEGSGEIFADTLFLTEAVTNLDEVTVVGERLEGRELVDRTVYSVPEQVAKTSANGYDILKKIPQVNVDFQNNVSLNGSTNFIIQVDGRQRDKEFLAKLLPSDIESIEIITNPSGKYEGNIDGVINIILKKEARYGMNGNVSAYVKPLIKITAVASGAIDYSLGKITFYVTGFTFTQNLDINSSNKTVFRMVDSLSNAAGEGDFKISSSSVNAGFDYYMNEKNSLSFNVSYKPVHHNVDMFSSADLFKKEIPGNTLTSNINNDLTSDEENVSLFYERKFKKSLQEFTAESNFYIFNSNSSNSFGNNMHVYNHADSTIYSLYRLENDLNDRNYFSTKLNYVQPLGLSAKIETGYQFYYQDMEYDFNTDGINEANNLFRYREYRNSVYAGFTLNLKKVAFQTFWRVENSHIRADSVTQPDYYCLLPSANFQYKLSASHNLKFTYNRRINRPGIYDMNPYPKISSNYDITQGNPDLKPEYRDHLQLTYTWNFGNNYFSPNIYYEFLSDKFGRRFSAAVSPADNNLATFSKPYNLLSGYEYGGGVNTNLWFVNINARIFKGHYDEYSGQSFTIPERDYFSYSITSYAYAPLTKDKKTNAFVFFSYNGVNVDAQTKTYSIPFYGLGGQKIIKDHTIGIFYLLPLSKNIEFQKVRTETPIFSSENVTGFDVSYYIQIMYSYKFTKGRSVKKINRDVQVESDTKNQGIGR